MSTSTSCPDPTHLKDLLDGTLPQEKQAELTAHLEGCTSCQQTLEGLVAGSQSWSSAAEKLGLQDVLADSALKEVVDELKGRASLAETDAGSRADELPLDFFSATAKPGQLGKLDHYEVIELVGKGGMGAVFKAFDEELRRIVAIKVMAPQLATTATARKRFTREAQAAAAVSHDHIVTIHAVAEANGLPYIVMQFVHGVSLQERLDQSGPLELKEILRIGLQTASGLAAAHAQGIVHRDIKPANILLENGVERVKITDFGLARAVDDAAGISQSGVIAGTPQYMSPEQAEGRPVDHRSDLFSLGSTLYAMCTGRAPFRAASTVAVLRRVSEDTPRFIKEINPEIPDWLCDVVARLHAKEPEDRFQSAKEVADLLGQHLAHLQQPAQPPMPARVEPPASGGRQPPGDSEAQTPGGLRPPLARRPRSSSHKVLVTVIIAVALVVLVLPCMVGIIGAAAWWLHHRDQATPDTPPPVALDGATTTPPEDGWVQLFNGKDLTGWQKFRGEFWSVQDGVLVSQVPHGGPQDNGFLISERDDYEDFHVRMEVKINQGGDSGLLFRALPGKVPGYQAQIYHGPGTALTGSVLLKAPSEWLHQVDQALVAPDTWFTLEVIAQGNHLVVKVDGKTVADVFDATYSRGHVKLESGRPGTVVHFKKIEIKELPPTPPTTPPLAIAPFDAAKAKEHQEAWARHLGVPVEITNSIGMKLRLIPPGEFLMGSTPEEIEAARVASKYSSEQALSDALNSEGPRHRVILSEPFYLSAREVTQHEFEKVAGSNPSSFKPGGAKVEYAAKVTGKDTSQHPVEGISWNDAAHFCSKLSTQEGHTPFYRLVQDYVEMLPGNGYRLPKEAQWEFACRAGSTTRFWFGDRDSDNVQAEWLSNNSGGRTHPVGSLKSNPFGLFDMHGNVSEWVQDGWNPEFYQSFKDRTAVDPLSKPQGQHLHMVRGGAWLTEPMVGGRSAFRLHAIPNKPLDSAGFRVMLSVDAARRILQQEPFVILAKDGRPEKAHATLADAVAFADSGDTLEIRGDGPFVTCPVVVHQNLLRLRAGPGCRPVLRLDETNDRGPVLLKSEGRLVLEGLELIRAGAKDPKNDPLEAQTGLLLRAKELEAAHCRFVVEEIGSAFQVSGPTLTLRSCEVHQRRDNYYVTATRFMPARSQTRLDNCIWSGQPLSLQPGTQIESVQVTLSHNTLLASLVVLGIIIPPGNNLPEAVGQAPWTMEFDGNVVQGKRFFYFSHNSDSYDLAASERFAKETLLWKSRRNLFAFEDFFFLLSGPAQLPKRQLDTLAQWHEFCGLRDTGDQTGAIRFQEELPWSLEPGSRRPEHFRLQPGSPGQGAGPGRTDLGADVDLVGPGAAYERWQQTPEYQRWLRDTGQVKADGE